MKHTPLLQGFASIMQGEFEMSMMGELNFFLGLQIKQMDEGTFISQSKYCKEILKKFEMDSAKAVSTPMATSYYLDKDELGIEVNQTMFRGMIGSLYILLQVDLILCNLYAFVLDIKLILRNHIL